MWAAAETFDLVSGAALPLALYRERSVSRGAALAALQDGELKWEIVYTSPSLKWEIVYTSPSLTGVRAAALGASCTLAAKSATYVYPRYRRLN